VSRRRSDALSPASIRNAMADLADEGYLFAAAYVSGAGSHGEGIPVLCPLSDRQAGSLPRNPSGCGTSSAHSTPVGACVERSSHILVELTSKSWEIAAAIPALAQELDQIELVPLADRRRPHDPGHPGPHGGATVVVALERAGLAGRSGLHPQLREPEFQRLAVGRGEAGVAAPDGGRPRPSTTR